LQFLQNTKQEFNTTQTVRVTFSSHDKRSILRAAEYDNCS